MHLKEADERTEVAREKVEERLGGGQFLGVIPGTGWRDGLEGVPEQELEGVFKQTDEIPYKELGVPMVSGEVEGHIKSVRVGTISGRDAVVLGRVHTNEDLRNPDLPQAMRVVVGAARNRLDGLVITNGVGTLHGRVGKEKGRIRSLVQTGILDSIGWAVRGRRQERIDVDDLAIIEDVITLALGSNTPLLGGEFEDPFSAPPGNVRGIHRDNDHFFDITRDAIKEVQGRCPRAVYFFIPGPQFEGPTMKRIGRLLGGDMFGMSGQEIMLATKWGIPFSNVAFATNGPFVAHNHADNGVAGLRGAQKTGQVLEVLAHTWPKR